MSFLPALPRFTEADFLRQLIGKRRFRGSEREGGLLRMLGADPIYHDEATNALRACPSCHVALPIIRNPPGFPDLVFVAGETLWLVELKAQRGKLSEPQRAWKAGLERVLRVRYALWRPHDVEEIVREVGASSTTPG